MKPKGETATALGNRLSRALTQTSEQQKGLKKPNADDTQIAFAPVIPAIVYEVATFFNMSVAAAYIWWQSKSESEKRAIRAQMQKGTSSSGNEGLDDCDYMHYHVDIPTCNAVSKRRGAAAGRRCFASANDRYAACMAGVPRDRLPPLDVWNN